MTFRTPISLAMHEDGRHEVVGCSLGNNRLEFLLPLPNMHVSKLGFHDKSDNLTIKLGQSVRQYSCAEERRRLFPGYRPILPSEVTELCCSQELDARTVLAKIIGSGIAQLPSTFVDVGVGHHPNGAPYCQVSKIGSGILIHTGIFLSRNGTELQTVIDDGSMDFLRDHKGNIIEISGGDRTVFDVGRIFRKHSVDVGKLPLREVDRANPDLIEHLYGCEYEEIPDILRVGCEFSLPKPNGAHTVLALGIVYALGSDPWQRSKSGDYICSDTNRLIVKRAYIGPGHDNPQLVCNK